MLESSACSSLLWPECFAPRVLGFTGTFKSRDIVLCFELSPHFGRRHVKM